MVMVIVMVVVMVRVMIRVKCRHSLLTCLQEIIRKQEEEIEQKRLAKVILTKVNGGCPERSS